ncbi:SCO5918 family protein [Streptomyces sp900105755]|uniref:SCO5918 family protein n=1 Tax=Streptomyces sp. 900105755 TaxID=3154389 RepID=UPI00332472DF
MGGTSIGKQAGTLRGGAETVKQVGQVITRQDRRDFSAAEVLRAMTQLGFTCRTLPTAAPVRILSSLQQASAMLGAPESV